MVLRVLRSLLGNIVGADAAGGDGRVVGGSRMGLFQDLFGYPDKTLLVWQMRMVNGPPSAR